MSMPPRSHKEPFFAHRCGGMECTCWILTSLQPKDDAKMARREQRKKLKQELIEKEKELQEVRSRISADEVLLRLRKQQSSELGSSMSECHEGEEQANTWIKALEEVFHKRTAKVNNLLDDIVPSLSVCLIAARA